MSERQGRYKVKPDGNQKQLVAFIRTLPGVSVFLTHRVGGGFPDVVIGYGGVNYLLEIKTEQGTLTPKEEEFFAGWRGKVNIVRSEADILELLELD